MDQFVVEALSQRDKAIKEEQQSLMSEYEELEEERQHIAALLGKYRSLSTNSALPTDSTSPLVSYQVNMPSEQPPDTQGNAQISKKTKTRHSPGETKKRIDYVLRRGEAHSIVSLARRIKELLDITVSESTVGVLLHRGLAIGEYKRDGSIWSMALNQSTPSQPSQGAFVDNDEMRNRDNEEAAFLASTRNGVLEGNS